MLLLCLGLLGLILSGCEGPLLSQLAVPTLGEKKKHGKQTWENACIAAISFLSTSLTEK